MLGRRRRWRNVGEDDRVQGDDADENGDDPEARKDGHLLNQRDGCDGDDQQAEAVADDPRHCRFEKLRVGHQNRLIAITQAVVLFVVAVHRLDRVAESARGQKDRDHQHQRIEVEAEMCGDPQTPHGRQDSRKHRHPDAGEGSEVRVEEKREGQEGERKDIDQLVGVLQHRGVEPRKAGDVDGMVVVLLGVLELHHVLVQVVEVERFLPEAGIDYGGGVVVGDVEAADVRVRIHREAHLIRFLLCLWNSWIKHGPYLQRSRSGGGAVERRVGDRQDLIRHHALGVDHVLGDAIELLQGLRVVDVAVLHLEDDLHDVGGAEHLAELVVEPDVRVLPWVEVEEVRMQADLGESVGKEQSQSRDHKDHRAAVAQQKSQVGFNPSLRNHSGSSSPVEMWTAVQSRIAAVTYDC